MQPALTPWTAAAAILAFGAAGLWTWILLEGIEVLCEPLTTSLRRARLAGAAACCAAMIAVAYGCWVEAIDTTESASVESVEARVH